MVSNELVLGALLALNVVLYASLGFAALRQRRRKVEPSNLMEAFNGLELALKKKPDMIILDLMMPDVDGFEVVSKLREDPEGSKIPILIYTAKNISSARK